MAAYISGQIKTFHQGGNPMKDYLSVLRKEEQKANAQIVEANQAFDKLNAEISRYKMAAAREIKRINRLYGFTR